MKQTTKIRISIFALAAIAISLFSFRTEISKMLDIPASLSNLSYVDGSLVFDYKGEKLKLYTEKEVLKDHNPWLLEQFDEVEEGTEDGIVFKFKKKFNGTLIYGLYPSEKMEYPIAVYFKKHSPIEKGKAEINIRKMLKGKYDLADWEHRKQGRLAYRVLDEKNNVVFNKSISFILKGDKFKIVPDITWGPFLSAQTKKGITIRFATNLNCSPLVFVNDKKYTSKKGKYHEFHIKGLAAGESYPYTIKIGDIEHHAELQTAPDAKNGRVFSFGFASDSRGGTQLGESNTQGHNADIIRKMAALAVSKKVKFWQFTGDMISGYKMLKGQLDIEYTSWLTTLSPFMHSTPLNVTMGNHEINERAFGDPKKYIAVDAFPYDEKSGEAIFASFFANPLNGPESEDGSSYDPNQESRDFPSYKENVYSYTYGNLAMIVMNSNYWYTPRKNIISSIGGNPHGYIMDNQLQWLKEELAKYEKMKGIEHIFVTIHTPAFPNGGHANNDMWYKGNNEVRPWIAGKAVDKGIIERRDQFLDLLVNHSKKFRVLLTGDEHNYSRLVVDKNTQIYPDDWTGDRIKLSRPFVQIVDGAAGAPYYAQETLPWTPSLKKFSAQYAFVLFHINGEKINIEVINPNTLETIEEAEIH